MSFLDMSRIRIRHNFECVGKEHECVGSDMALDVPVNNMDVWDLTYLWSCRYGTWVWDRTC